MGCCTTAPFRAGPERKSEEKSSKQRFGRYVRLPHCVEREVAQSNDKYGLVVSNQWFIWLIKAWKEKDWRIRDQEVWGRGMWKHLWAGAWCVTNFVSNISAQQRAFIYHGRGTRQPTWWSDLAGWSQSLDTPVTGRMGFMTWCPGWKLWMDPTAWAPSHQGWLATAESPTF